MRGARSEAIALREVDRARNRAGHLVQTRGARFDRRDGAKQATGVLVTGVGEDLLRRTLLDDLPRIHDGDRMGDFGHEREIVGNEDHGEAELLAQRVEQIDDLLLHGHVKCGRRFVGDDELRVTGQRHGDKHTLALAAGKLVRIRFKRALGIKADEFEQFLGAARAAALRQLLHLRLDEHRRVERAQCILVDHRDLMAADLIVLALVASHEVPAVEQDLAADSRLRVEQAHDGERGDRLAAAGLADETHRLPRAYGEVEVVDDVDVAVARELDAQILDLEHGRFGAPRFKAIGALEFGVAKLGERIDERIMLLGVGRDRVGEQTVFLAVGSHVGRGLLDRGGRGRHHRVGYAFGQDVQAQYGDHDRKTGVQRLPPIPEDDAFLRGRQDVAPCRRRLGDAGIDEAQ